MPNFYAGLYADRRADERENPAWLTQARADPEARFVITAGTQHLLQSTPEPQILFLTAEHPVVASANEQEAILLGWFHGARCVLIEISRPEIADVPENAFFEELRPLSTQLPADEAGLLAYIRALVIWRSRHQFCGVCGSPTTSERAGHMVKCTNPDVAHEHFPRIDPAVIVLVTDGDRVLLGRQASWPAGRFSTIAGFVEPGESLEDAVLREVHEETGVRVREIEYHSSQPWPFPSSLMVGFFAVAEPGSEIHITPDGELEDAGWFTREDIASGRPLLPFSHSISYRLVQAWFDSEWPEPLASLRPGSAR
jgi:NAD+ diphosphatase